jgi:hypothetical protein
MPTSKQVRFHMSRIYKLIDRLDDALTEAHNADVIEYDSKNYAEEGPCFAFSEVKSRVNKTTEKQLARAMRDEIRSGK